MERSKDEYIIMLKRHGLWKGVSLALEDVYNEILEPSVMFELLQDHLQPKIDKGDKIVYEEFVKMTREQHDKLVFKLGIDFTIRCIEKLNNAKGATGKKYKSDYHAILNWVTDALKRDGHLPSPTNKPRVRI